MIDTTGRVLAAFSFIAFALNIAPFCYHWGRKNIPACSLFFWLLYNTLTAFINAVIWSGENFYEVTDAPVYCDITVRISTASSVGKICSIGCLTMNLFFIIDARHSRFLEPNSKRRTFINVMVCWATPVCIMGTSMIVQINRYVIIRYRGCVPAYGANVATLLLVSIWPLVWSAVAFAFAVVTVWTYMKKRQDIKDILRCTNSGLTLRRFARLLIFSLLIMFVMCPFAIYNFTSDLRDYGLSKFSWSETHSAVWGHIYKFDAGKLQFAGRIIDIVLSVVAFLLFGMGSDALALYYRFLGRLGFKKFRETSIDSNVFMAHTYIDNRNERRNTGLTGQTMDSEKTMMTLKTDECDFKDLLFDEVLCSAHLTPTLSEYMHDNGMLEEQLAIDSANSHDIEFDFKVVHHE